MISKELEEKIRKDFNVVCAKGLMSVDETDWLPYKAGYLDALRRFGGQNSQDTGKKSYS